MSDVTLQRFSVLGAAGAMGALFARELRGAGRHVTGFDLRQPSERGDFDDFLVDDALRPSPASLDAWRVSDCVIIALPHAPALAGIKAVVSAASPRALVVDTHSVKTPVVQLLDSLPAIRCEYLSINPMFAPSLGFRGQKIVAVPCRAGDATRAFVHLMETWGVTVEHRSAEAHDRASAVMQVATHLALLLLGRAVRDGGVAIDDLLKIAPPPHLMLLAMLARVLNGAPETYWDIQKDNPFGDETRQRMAAALTHFDTLVRANNEGGFAAALKTIRERIEPAIPVLLPTGTAAIKAATDAMKRS